MNNERKSHFILFLAGIVTICTFFVVDSYLSEDDFVQLNTSSIGNQVEIAYSVDHSIWVTEPSLIELIHPWQTTYTIEDSETVISESTFHFTEPVGELQPGQILDIQSWTRHPIILIRATSLTDSPTQILSEKPAVPRSTGSTIVHLGLTIVSCVIAFVVSLFFFSILAHIPDQ